MRASSRRSVNARGVGILSWPTPVPGGAGRDRSVGRRSPSRDTAALVLLFVLLACAFHVARTGLVLAPEAGVVSLVEPGGARTTLRLDADSAALRYLHDVIVEVEGTCLGGRMIVRDWKVIDAGDGSNGYVGRLQVTGLRVLIQDRNSGATLILDDANSAPLRAFGGKMVLIIGHVSGPDTVTPMAWRLLEAE